MSLIFLRSCKCGMCFFFSILFIYLPVFFTVLGLHCCMGFFLVVVSRGYSVVEVYRPVIVVASLVVEQCL